MKYSVRKLLMRVNAGDAEGAVRAVSDVGGRVGGFVVGADLLVDRGPILVGALCALGKPLLADLGILDRPRVVARAVARMGKLGARWVSVSGLGGRGMVEAAVSEAEKFPDTTVVLSAMLAGWAGDDELKGVGISDTPGGQVSRMTRLALRTGAAGILFPARELGVVVQASGAKGGGGVAKTGALSRMAEVSDHLSSPRLDAAFQGGAHWVVATQEQIVKLDSKT